jgi:hypothetical protein
VDRTIIHLIGSPAVGKYTIASRVARITGARLVDNHSIANVIFNLLDQDGVRPLPAGVWSHVSRVRAAVLDTLIHISPPELSFVFTNYMRGEDPAEYAAFEELVAVAEIRGSTFVPVILSCETPELVRRIGSPDRRERMKLIDPIQGAYLNDEVPHFTTKHPNKLELDTSRTTPDEAAARVVAWAERCAVVG